MNKLQDEMLDVSESLDRLALSMFGNTGEDKEILRSHAVELKCAAAMLVEWASEVKE